jgi:TolB-like protein/Tfp pilus assembly protein PilF
VLPLENLSRDPDQDFFADGMTEALITDLSKIGALRVIARASVMRYKGGQTSIPDMARALKVDAIVTGTVTRSGNRVRITAQLIEAATERNLWANGYDGDLSDALTLQNRVARAIAEEIKVSVTPEEHARLATSRRVDPGAHEAYLRGRAQVDKRTRDGFARAIEQFNRAIELDPGFAEAHAGLADAYALIGYFGFGPSSEVFAQSKAAATKAVAMNDGLAEAHEALAMVSFFDWDWAGAEPEFKRAIALNPNFATAHHWYSHYLVSLDRDVESVESSERALRLEPLNANIAAHLAWAYYYADRYDDAIRQCDRTMELDPTYYQSYYFRGMALTRTGKGSEAIADFKKALALPAVPRMQILGPLGHAYALAGQRAEAERTFKEFGAESQNFALNPELAAQIAAGLGQKARALDLLERGLALHSGQMLNINVEPALESLRSEPRFRQILRKMGLAK